MTDAAHVLRASIAGILAVGSVAGCRFAYGVTLVGLAARLETDIAAVGLGFAVHWIVVTLTAPVAWRVYLAWGARRMMAVGGSMCAASFALLPLASDSASAVILYGVLSGIGSQGLGQLVANQPVIAATRPGRRRDRSFGLIACGAPVGTSAVSAAGTLAIEHLGWPAGCQVVAGLVLAGSWSAAFLAGRPLPPAIGPWSGLPSTNRPVWFSTTFALLGAGFAIALFVQITVPFVLPTWSLTQGISAAELAIGFTIFGIAGVAGRLLMTSRIVVRGVRLWPVVPAALISLAGAVIAASSSGEVAFFMAVGLLGFATPLIGAMFAIASLACFTEQDFTRVGGALLVPIGIASALAAFVPAALLGETFSPAWVWLGIGALSLMAAMAIVSAELVSPVARRRRNGYLDETV
jgi:hypothetical protein